MILENLPKSDINITAKTTTQVPMRNPDGTIVLNAYGETVYQAQFLNSHPLKRDCKERTGPNGMKLTYVTGDGVIRDLNTVFGHGQWSTEITMEKEIISKVDDEGRWNVGYLATVKLTLLTTGALHEDVGSGEAINESKLKAHEMALKAAVTDAMKRAARHFGERLGNALYRSGASLANAPRDNKTALQRVDWNHGLDFGNQAELHDQKKRGLPFPPKPGSKEAVIDTTMKQSNKALKPERNTMNQQLQLKSNQHQQPIQQASNEPLARISIEPSSDVLQITPMASRQQPAIVHPGSSSYGFVRASAVQEIFSVTPQAPQHPQLVTKQPPLPRYAPLDRTSPSEKKRKGSDELESPRVAKRLHVTLCNPYR